MAPVKSKKRKAAKTPMKVPYHCSPERKQAKMLTIHRALGAFLIVSVPLLAIGSAQSPVSEVVRECDDTRSCVPDATSLAIVYVYDAADVPIAGMTVTAVSASASTSVASAQTDNDGMAAVSLRVGQSYTMRITGPDWTPLILEPKMTAKGSTRLLRVVMRVPPIVCFQTDPLPGFSRSRPVGC